MSEPITIALISTIGTITVAIIAATSPIVQNIVRFKLPKLFGNKTEMIVALEKNIELADILDSFEALPGIKKAVLMETTNGGGIPRPGKGLYSSIVAPVKWKWSWDKQALDAENQKIVLDIYNNGEKKFDIDTLSDNGILKPLFKHQGIEYCECFLISETRERLLFVTIDYFDKSLRDYNTIDETRININKIKNLLK